MREISLLAGLAMAAVAAPAGAVVTFDDLTEGQAFTSYTTADGVRIRANTLSTSVQVVKTGFGLSLLSNERPSGTYLISLEIDREDGKTFRLGSIDFGTLGFNGQVIYTATNRTVVDSGTIALPSQTLFTTIGFVDVPLTQLSLAVYSQTEAVALDNIVVSAVAGGLVPEPGTWVMMAAGFGILGAAVRRRRRSNVAC